MAAWYGDIEEVISPAEIAKRVAELGRSISRDFVGRELVLIGVLKGSFLFMADLCRHIELPITCDFFGLSSYGDQTKSTGVIRITSDLKRPIAGKDVLVVEDIVDTGLTVQYLQENLKARRAGSIKVCSLLDKPSRRVVPAQIDYLGFSVPNLFVVGYGLDFKGRYRNLPFVGKLPDDHPEIAG